MYEGIFFEGKNKQIIYNLEKEPLKIPIDKLHCTFKYRPKDEEIFNDLVGEVIEVELIGYGCNGDNSGFLIKLPSNIIDYYINYGSDFPKKRVKPHITVSLSDKAEAKNTKDLDFLPLDKAVKIKGRFGYCIKEQDKEFISYENKAREGKTYGKNKRRNRKNG